MSVFKMSNKIFGYNLTPNELYVYTYLCSVPGRCATLLGKVVKVKQATVAQKCNIKTTETVSRVISSLMRKGLVERVIRTMKDDRGHGTNSYIIKKLSYKDGFFYVDRSVFGIASARQMRVYLFIAKSFDYKRKDSWNSYNDIGRQLNISRSEVIKMVAELVALKLITKSLRKSKANRRVYVDNHYTIILYQNKEKVKIKRKPRGYCVFFKVLNKLPTAMLSSNIYQSLLPFFVMLARGSPTNQGSLLYPRYILQRKKKE